MHYIATLEHRPENCLGREEPREEPIQLVPEIDQRAEDHGVDLHAAYGTPDEPTVYVVLEADGFDNVIGFLRSPILRDDDAEPVLTVRESVDVVAEE